jgi:hypothetical protein
MAGRTYLCVCSFGRNPYHDTPPMFGVKVNQSQDTTGPELTAKTQSETGRPVTWRRNLKDNGALDKQICTTRLLPGSTLSKPNGGVREK